MKVFQSLVSAVTLALAASSSLASPVTSFNELQPLSKRDGPGGLPKNPNDAKLLIFGQVITEMGASLYRHVLTFSDSDLKQAGFHEFDRQQLSSIAETYHRQSIYLASSLGSNTTNPLCDYQFTGIISPLSISGTLLYLQQLFNSALLSAIPKLSKPWYQTDFASLLAIGTSQQGFLRSTLSTSDYVFPINPSPFYTPLDFNLAFNILLPFTTSTCSSLTNNGIKYYNDLTIRNANAKGAHDSSTTSFQPNQIVEITLDKTNLSTSKPTFIGFIQNYGSLQPIIFVPISEKNGDDERFIIQLPKELVPGAFFVVLTTSQSEISDKNMVAGPVFAEILANPLV